MAFDRGQVMAVVLRMVMPIRREFGLQLDVQTFLHDLAYAKKVLAEAATSQDPLLREKARYVSQLMFGPRAGVAEGMHGAAAPAPPVAADTTVPQALDGVPPAAGPASEPAADSPSTTDEALRARILRKYTDGLR